ncbi:methylmalonyl-CoA mutase family protein, partial [Escherichia coli]
AIGLPKSDFSRRIARNTGIILAEESNIGRANDPAGGSFYVEALTKKLEDAGWAEFQAVEAAGGMAAALTGDHVRTELDKLNT